ncbi:MAG TPA: hypothetical protein VHI13_01800 [Candidatus Kapabacteria bacterium]|nr:hypothetical protein [Candidatus Kapabacteria bacterium]
MLERIIESEWNEADRTLTTRLAGPLTLDEVEAWEDGLYRTSDAIPFGCTFAMLIDMTGYNALAVDRATHAFQRAVIPTFLAAYDHRAAYLKLFDDIGEIAAPRRDAICGAVAHVHHDCTKMESFERELATENERFFCTRDAALEWLRTIAASLP